MRSVLRLSHPLLYCYYSAHPTTTQIYTLSLHDALPISTDEVFKMASQGKISFSEFESAMSSATGSVAAEMGGATMGAIDNFNRSEEHTSELQSRGHLVCRLLLEKKNETLALCSDCM